MIFLRQQLFQLQYNHRNFWESKYIFAILYILIHDGLLQTLYLYQGIPTFLLKTINEFQLLNVRFIVILIYSDFFI